MADFFFDAHFHPTLKKHFANPADTDAFPMSNPWRTAVRNDFLAGFNKISITKCLLKPFVESSLISQSSLSQLKESNCRLGIVVLFAPDKGLLELIEKNKDFMKIVESGKFGNTLIKEQFVDLVSENNAFAIVERDLEFLEKSNQAGEKVIPLTKTSDFNLTDTSLPQIVFSLEGPHCLRSDLNAIDENTILADISTNLDKLAQKEVKIIYVNLTHIDNGNTIFANQAYAVDAFRVAGFNESHLRPIGNGLTPLGEQLTKLLLQRQILPDIKHLSWKARQQFYALHRAEFADIPIICSHAGFTGCWFNKHGESVSDFFVQKPKKVGNQQEIILAKPTHTSITDVCFNVSSINLFNEDIEAIFHSNGLIGISLDQRILGYNEVQRLGDKIVSDNVRTVEIGFRELNLIIDTEYISLEEIHNQSPYAKKNTNAAKLLNCMQVFDIGNSADVKEHYHPRHFYLHLVHAIRIARQIGIEQGNTDAAVRKMLTQTLCIGSDFDGLIDGIDCCETLTGLTAFKAKFIDEFEDFLIEAGEFLPTGLTIQTIADRIFYENGRDFVLLRLDAINQ